MAAALHIVQRADGVWQVEPEDGLVPLSLHETRDAALDSALDVARREGRSLRLHRSARRRVRRIDRLAHALLSRDLDATARRRRAG